MRSGFMRIEKQTKYKGVYLFVTLNVLTNSRGEISASQLRPINNFTNCGGRIVLILENKLDKSTRELCRKIGCLHAVDIDGHKVRRIGVPSMHDEISIGVLTDGIQLFIDKQTDLKLAAIFSSNNLAIFLKNFKIVRKNLKILKVKVKSCAPSPANIGKTLADIQIDKTRNHNPISNFIDFKLNRIISPK